MIPATRRGTSQNWVPAIFNDFFDNNWMLKTNATAPAINVYETKNDYCVELAAPGMTKKDFDIQVNEDKDLVISMEKKTEDNEKESKEEGRYLRREFSYTKYQQTLILPDDVNPDKIEAKVCDGVLTIHLPRHTPEVQQKATKQISIS